MFKSRFLIVVLLFFIMACSAKESQNTPQQFWHEFRAAVMASDFVALQNLSKLPLALHGAVDGVPVQEVDGEQFETVMKDVLDQPLASYEGDLLITYTQRDLVIKTAALEGQMVKEGGGFRVGELVFEPLNGRWQLVRAYLSE